MAKKAKARKPEDIERDDFLRCVHLLNAAFGPMIQYDTWADVPQFDQLPKGANSHCHECLTPHRASLYPTCGWCKAKAS